MNQHDLFCPILHCVVFGTNKQTNKKFVLSINRDKIIFPKLSLTKDLLNNDIEDNLIKFLKQYVFVSDMYLMPQLINIHSSIFDTQQENILNIIYGFVIEQTININNSYWIELDLTKSIPENTLLYEVIHKLQ